MQAIILAGGFGTRLQSVVKDVPKPMADIAGKPFLYYLIKYLTTFSQKNHIILSVNYLKEKIISYFGDKFLNAKISYAVENHPLGTGGAIVNSLKNCDTNEPIIILNGDSFIQIDYQKLLDFHKKNKSKLTIVLKKMDDCSRYGAVEIDNQNQIISFKEKSQIISSGLINSGVYVIEKDIFNQFDLPEKFSFEQDFLMRYLSEIKPCGLVVDDYFIDIGIPEDYNKASEELPKIINFLDSLNNPLYCNKALFLDRDGVINKDHGHVYKRDNFEFVEGIFDLAKKAQDAGYLIVVITNQAGIAKGYYNEEQFLELTKWVEDEFLKRDITISKTFYCPYHVDAKIEKYRRDSFDRKPNPGMIYDAVEQFKIDVRKSIFIGDNDSDMAAARGASVGSRFLLKDSFIPKNII